MVDSIRAAALKGIHQSLENAADHAQQINKAFRPDSEEDALRPIIGLKTDALQVKANSKVIQVSRELDKSILDILA